MTGIEIHPYDSACYTRRSDALAPAAEAAKNIFVPPGSKAKYILLLNTASQQLGTLAKDRSTHISVKRRTETWMRAIHLRDEFVSKFLGSSPVEQALKLDADLAIAFFTLNGWIFTQH